jgi:hypothetical protein
VVGLFNLIPELMILEKLSNRMTRPSVSKEKKLGALGLTNYNQNMKRIINLTDTFLQCCALE